LSMTNERVNNVWMEQEASKEKQINHFVNYKLDHQENYETNDRRVQEFAELLQKYNANQQQSAVEELLEITKERLFLDI
jgi:DNA-directed RNA polymerase subunit F